MSSKIKKLEDELNMTERGVKDKDLHQFYKEVMKENKIIKQKLNFIPQIDLMKSKIIKQEDTLR